MYLKFLFYLYYYSKKCNFFYSFFVAFFVQIYIYKKKFNFPIYLLQNLYLIIKNICVLVRVASFFFVLFFCYFTKKKKKKRKERQRQELEIVMLIYLFFFVCVCAFFFQGYDWVCLEVPNQKDAVIHMIIFEQRAKKFCIYKRVWPTNIKNIHVRQKKKFQFN